MAQTPAPLWVIPAGARDHTSAATQACLAAPRERLTAEPLPAYSPDDKPIAYLGKQTTQQATHHTDFQEFVELTVSVETALAYFATPPETV